MAKATTRVAETWTYTLRADLSLPLDEQSRFTLRPMTLSERQRVEDDIARQITHPDGTREVVSRSNQVALEIALRHIIGVDNFPAGDPKPWPTNGREEREKYLEMLRDTDVVEIGNHVWQRCSIEPATGGAPTDSTIKNS